MIYVKMLNVHRWHRTWSDLVVEPDTIGELKGIQDGLFSVLWPDQVKAVLCLLNTLEVVEVQGEERGEWRSGRFTQRSRIEYCQ